MIALTLLIMSAPVAEPQTADPCAYDPSILSLSFEKFDQDMEGGWRKVAKQPGCEKTAADIVRSYRSNMKQQISTLYFHEGQLSALAGDNLNAVAMLRNSFEKEDVYGWNPYVRATIAFLNRDLQQLKKEREELKQLAKPDDWDDEWPLNLGVVDRLINCFEKTYKEAYSGDCQTE